MYFHHTHLINAAPPFPHLIVGSRPAAAMLDDSANCHAAKHAQTSIMPTPPYTIAVVQRGAYDMVHLLRNIFYPATIYPSPPIHQYRSNSVCGEAGREGLWLLTTGRAMMLTITVHPCRPPTLVGIGGLRLQGIRVRVRDTKTSILAQSLNHFRTTLRPAI